MKALYLIALIALTQLAQTNEALARVTCMDSNAKMVDPIEEAWAGEFQLDFDLEVGAIMNFGISQNFDNTIGYSDPNSVSYDEVRKQSSNTYASSPQWRNAEAYVFKMGDDTEYVLLLNREIAETADGATQAVRLKSLDDGRSISMKCSNY